MRYRYFVYAAIVLACAIALLSFDNADVGLATLNIVLWPIVIAAGAIVLLKARHGPRRTRRRHQGTRSRDRHQAISAPPQKRLTKR
jgi:hypothetical protein